ncbi:unnamed protein product (macronuclear) [Paramecium tetraurelia]|uniref:Transmembrane protein n=1 Tax=Paramecium tetraurelia TaxID=5888 RepID=A0EBJ6_PARTE|nr:uncharacterized protein GSPATT00025397001 [Paramecium tetraurelia]CAK92663.1 unnamed protein product [Paramecium tetraurelia]|eukprot:XP_001460060.1 hypothetical protein (macronuclear) [Paramecium tetraurelia strain d4-2]
MHIYLLMLTMALVNGTVKQIGLNEVVDDAIEAYDFKVYRLQLHNPEKLQNRTLIVQLLPQIGNPKVAVDCDTEPKLLDYYEWQTGSWFLQQLSISYQERQAVNCTDNQFYIGVSSEVVSGYSLVTYVLDGIQQLEYNIPLSGELVEKEILQFKLKPNQSTEQITLQITANQAEKFLKQCSKEDCQITLSDYEANNTDTAMHLTQSSLTFVHNDCQDCYYLIGLKSDSKTQFRILAKHQEQHVVLREGQQEQFHVEEGFYIYYLYNIPNDTNIKSVKFQITQYNGTCTLYGSSSEQYPNFDKFEMKSLSQLKASNAKTFYLSVYGNTQCHYGIYTQVERYQTINQTYFIQLQSGVPQKYLSGDQYSFFYIQLTQKQNFTISLQNIEGNFIMYVKSNLKNKEIPDSNSYQWKDQKQIEINIDDPNYATQYYIGVQNLNDHGEFIIQYTLHGDIEFYQVGQQIIGTVAEKKFRYYKLPMQSRNLIITKDIYSGNDVFDLDMFISLDQKNTHPSLKHYNIYLIGKNLTIPDTDLQCPQNTTKINEKNLCYIYIAVTSSSGTIFYTISTKYNNSLIQLHEGYPQTVTFDQETLFYYILKNKELSLQWYSYGGSQANIEPYFGNKDNSDLRYETFKAHSYFTQFQSFTIPETEKYQVLYIRVQPIEPHYQNDTYTIGVYEEVKLLTLSDPIIDVIQKGQTKYYKLSLTQDVKSIQVNIHVKGGGEFVNARISKGKDQRPSLSEFNQQWSHIFRTTYILQEVNNRYLAKDDYIIGVFGEEECEFQINYNTDDAKFVNAFLGYPFDVLFHEDIPHYYIFRDDPNDKEYKIIVFAFQGKLQVRAKALESIDDETIISINDHLFIDEIVDKQKSFKVKTCEKVGCVYSIEITAVQGNSKGLIEFSGQKYQTTLYDNLQWREVLSESESSQYRFYSNVDVQISVSLISGDIRLYLKEGQELLHNDEADLTSRIQQDTLILFEKKKTLESLITIKVESLVPVSVFMISAVRIEKQTYTIHLGQMMTYQIKAQETIKLQYQSVTQTSNNQQKFVTLQIQNIHQSIENLYFDITHTSIKPINYFNKYPKAISYHLYDQFGLYEISIKALHNQTFIGVIITNGELNALIDSISQYQLTKMGQPNYYEVFLQQKSKLFLEVFTCSGSILVQGTKNETNLAKQIFEIQVMNSSKDHIQSILQLDEVKLISSHTQDDNKNKISSYFIKQQTFDQGEVIPQTSFEISDKSVDWYKVDDNLIIHIPNLIQVKQDIQAIHIYFIVRMQQAIGEKSLACMFESNYVNNKTNVYGKYTQVVEQSNTSNFTTVTFTTKDQQAKYLSVVGKVQLQIEYQTEELTYPLPIIEMNYTNNLQESTQQWILLGIFLTILFVTGASLEPQHTQY